MSGVSTHPTGVGWSSGHVLVPVLVRFKSVESRVGKGFARPPASRFTGPFSFPTWTRPPFPNSSSLGPSRRDSVENGFFGRGWEVWDGETPISDSVSPRRPVGDRPPFPLSLMTETVRGATRVPEPMGPLDWGTYVSTDRGPEWVTTHCGPHPS